MLMRYLKRVGVRRIIIMVMGNVFLGMGVAIFKMSGMGNDPFNAMIMSLSNVIGIPYEIFIILFNLCLFVIQLLFGRELIGAGTLVNACLLGYFTTFFYNLITTPFGVPQLLWQRLLCVCAGVLASSFGVSMYQTPDVGVAPFDSISLIMVKRFPKIPYFWHRITYDALAALVAFLSGGIVGLGTVLSALGLGPFVHFFNEHFSKKVVGPIDEKG